MKIHSIQFITLLSLFMYGCENIAPKDVNKETISKVNEESVPGSGDTIWTVADEIIVPQGTTVIRIDPSTLPLMLFNRIQPEIGPTAVMMEVQPFSKSWSNITQVPIYFKFGKHISYITINDTIRIENMGEEKYFQRIPLMIFSDFNSYPVQLYSIDGKSKREYLEIEMDRVSSPATGINIENNIDVNISGEE